MQIQVAMQRSTKQSVTTGRKKPCWIIGDSVKKTPLSAGCEAAGPEQRRGRIERDENNLGGWRRQEQICKKYNFHGYSTALQRNSDLSQD
jgi:hypothetical protein